MTMEVYIKWNFIIFCKGVGKERENICTECQRNYEDIDKRNKVTFVGLKDGGEIQEHNFNGATY